MSRRRFPLRLQHGDALLVMAAVATATAVGWLVLELSGRPSQHRAAYSVEAPGVRLPDAAAERLLRESFGRQDAATVTVVASDAGTSIGVVYQGDEVGRLDQARRLAAEIGSRMSAYALDTHRRKRIDGGAEELYELDMRVRDLLAARSAGGRKGDTRLASALALSRLLRERNRVLTSRRPGAPPQPASEVRVVERARVAAGGRLTRLAVAGVFIVVGFAGMARLACSRGVLVAATLGRPAQRVRRPQGLELSDLRAAA